MPSELDGALATLASRNRQSTDLLLFSLRLQSPKARAAALALVQKPEGLSIEDRVQVIGSLAEQPSPDLTTALLALAESAEPTEIRRAAIQGLRRAQDPRIPTALLALAEGENHQAVVPTIFTVLAGHPDWAARLLEAFEGKKLDPALLTIDQRLIIQGHRRASLDESLAVLSPTSISDPDKQAKLVTLRSLLDRAPGKSESGEEIFAQVCGNCHRLFDQGASIGPDLTGYDRSDREFLLTAIVDPNLGVREEYELTTLTLRPATADDPPTLLAGYVRKVTDTQLTIQDLTGQETTVAQQDILKKDNSAVSLMPEGILDALTEEQVRDLFTYLQKK